MGKGLVEKLAFSFNVVSFFVRASVPPLPQLVVFQLVSFSLLLISVRISAFFFHWGGGIGGSIGGGIAGSRIVWGL